MRYWLLGALLGLGINATLDALGLHWLRWPAVGLLAAFVVVSQLTVWYREGWRLRWPPGKRS